MRCLCGVGKARYKSSTNKVVRDTTNKLCAHPMRAQKALSSQRHTLPRPPKSKPGARCPDYAVTAQQNGHMDSCQPYTEVSVLQISTVGAIPSTLWKPSNSPVQKLSLGRPNHDLTWATYNPDPLSPKLCTMCKAVTSRRQAIAPLRAAHVPSCKTHLNQVAQTEGFNDRNLRGRLTDRMQTGRHKHSNLGIPTGAPKAASQHPVFGAA